MGQTDPKGQNIIDHGYLLIKREKAFCESKYLFVLSRKSRLLIKSLKNNLKSKILEKECF